MSSMEDSDNIAGWAYVNRQGNLHDDETSSTSSSVEIVDDIPAMIAPDNQTAGSPNSQGPLFVLRLPARENEVSDTDEDQTSGGRSDSPTDSQPCAGASSSAASNLSSDEEKSASATSSTVNFQSVSNSNTQVSQEALEELCRTLDKMKEQISPPTSPVTMPTTHVITAHTPSSGEPVQRRRPVEREVSMDSSISSTFSFLSQDKATTDTSGTVGFEPTSAHVESIGSQETETAVDGTDMERPETDGHTGTSGDPDGDTNEVPGDEHDVRRPRTFSRRQESPVLMALCITIAVFTGFAIIEIYNGSSVLEYHRHDSPKPEASQASDQDVPFDPVSHCRRCMPYMTQLKEYYVHEEPQAAQIVDLEKKLFDVTLRVSSLKSQITKVQNDMYTSHEQLRLLEADKIYLAGKLGRTWLDIKVQRERVRAESLQEWADYTTLLDANVIEEMSTVYGLEIKPNEKIKDLVGMLKDVEKDELIYELNYKLGEMAMVLMTERKQKQEAMDGSEILMGKINSMQEVADNAQSDLLSWIEKAKDCKSVDGISSDEIQAELLKATQMKVEQLKARLSMREWHRENAAQKNSDITEKWLQARRALEDCQHEKQIVGTSADDEAGSHGGSDTKRQHTKHYRWTLRKLLTKKEELEMAYTQCKHDVEFANRELEKLLIADDIGYGIPEPVPVTDDTRPDGYDVRTAPGYDTITDLQDENSDNLHTEKRHAESVCKQSGKRCVHAFEEVKQSETEKLLATRFEQCQREIDRLCQQKKSLKKDLRNQWEETERLQLQQNSKTTECPTPTWENCKTLMTDAYQEQYDNMNAAWKEMGGKFGEYAETYLPADVYDFLKRKGPSFDLTDEDTDEETSTNSGTSGDPSEEKVKTKKGENHDQQKAKRAGGRKKKGGHGKSTRGARQRSEADGDDWQEVKSEKVDFWADTVLNMMNQTRGQIQNTWQQVKNMSDELWKKHSPHIQKLQESFLDNVNHLSTKFHQKLSKKVERWFGKSKKKAEAKKKRQADNKQAPDQTASTKKVQTANTKRRQFANDGIKLATGDETMMKLSQQVQQLNARKYEKLLAQNDGPLLTLREHIQSPSDPPEESMVRNWQACQADWWANNVILSECMEYLCCWQIKHSNIQDYKRYIHRRKKSHKGCGCELDRSNVIAEVEEDQLNQDQEEEQIVSKCIENNKGKQNRNIKQENRNNKQKQHNIRNNKENKHKLKQTTDQDQASVKINKAKINILDINTDNWDDAYDPNDFLFDVDDYDDDDVSVETVDEDGEYADFEYTQKDRVNRKAGNEAKDGRRHSESKYLKQNQGTGGTRGPHIHADTEDTHDYEDDRDEDFDVDSNWYTARAAEREYIHQEPDEWYFRRAKDKNSVYKKETGAEADYEDKELDDDD